MDRKIIHAGTAILAIISLLPASVVAQDQKMAGQTAPDQPPAQQASPAGTTSPIQPRTVDLRMDYSTGRKWFPDIIGPYTPMSQG